MRLCQLRVSQKTRCAQATPTRGPRLRALMVPPRFSWPMPTSPTPTLIPDVIFSLSQPSGSAACGRSNEARSGVRGDPDGVYGGTNGEVFLAPASQVALGGIDLDRWRVRPDAGGSVFFAILRGGGPWRVCSVTSGPRRSLRGRMSIGRAHELQVASAPPGCRASIGPTPGSLWSFRCVSSR
jgi:hypothetical protein